MQVTPLASSELDSWGLSYTTHEGFWILNDMSF